MIEIVRNAATIAAVQRSLGGTTATFRNDALFEWLRSKCPLQEIVSQIFPTATTVLLIGSETQRKDCVKKFSSSENQSTS